jgi:ADP-dependent glucokinase
MYSMGPDTKVHFEMASFAELDLLKQLTKYVVPYSDSMGMNEQVRKLLRAFDFSRI